MAVAFAIASKVIGSPGKKRAAPAETRREREFGIALLHHRLTDQVVEGAVEIAAAVQERFRSRYLARQHGLERRTNGFDQRLHLGIRRNCIREDRHQLVANARDLLLPHLDIEASKEFSVRPCAHQHRIADAHQVRHCVMGMRRQDNIDAFDAARELFVDIETIVGQEHYDIGAFGPRRLDFLL